MRTSRAILALALLVASAAVVSATNSGITVKADFAKTTNGDVGTNAATNGYSGVCTWCTSSRLPITAPPRIPHVRVPLDREPASSVSFARLCRDRSFTRG